MLKQSTTRLAVAIACLGALALSFEGRAQEKPAEDVLARVVDVDIPAQSLTGALIALSERSGVQILMSADVVNGHTTAGVRGRMTLGEALRQLLKGTPLGFHAAGPNSVGIDPPLGAVPVQPERAATDVAASDPDAVQFDTVVVTAGKRLQDIRAVPGSLAALNGDDLERRAARSMEDYLKLVPGVTYSKASIDNGVPVIRGIATGTGVGQTPVPVGIYVDEVPFGDLFLPTSVTDMHPFDLERVEVLKGPQGTLFGSGSLSGAIRYITHKPDPSVWQAKLMAGSTAVAGGGEGPLGAGMVNVPLGDSAGLRLVGVYQETPGVVDEPNRGVEDADRVEQTAGRALANWQPTERLNLDLMYYLQKSEQDNEGFADQYERRERNSVPEPTPRKSEFDVANLTGSYEFDWGTLLSSTSRKTKDIRNIQNLARNQGQGTYEDPGPEDQSSASFVLPLDAIIEGFHQELRVASPGGAGPWQWIAGAAYQRDTEFLLNTQPTPGLTDLIGTSPLAGNPSTRILLLQYIELDATATEKAVFGEVTRTLWDRWEFTAGGRYFKTELVADTFFTGIILATVAGSAETAQRISVEESGFNPKFSINFRAFDNASIYALAAKGFQFGGVQVLPATPTTTTVAGQGNESGFVPYKSSDLWNYELGVRTDWWGHRLQLDATWFYLDWKDLQLTQTDANRVFSFVGNVGEAHSTGVEASLALTPLRGLRLQTGAAWIDAVTDVFYEAPGGNVEAGTFLPGTTKFAAASVLSYEPPFSIFGFSLGADVTHTYTGEIFSDLQHTRTMPPYELWDARVHLARSDWRLAPELSFAVTNIRDKMAISSINDRSRGDDIWFIRPRTATLSLLLRFF